MLSSGANVIVGAQDFIYDSVYMTYSYEGQSTLVWACRQLSGAARAYIPLSILRLPYSSYLST